MDYQRTLDLLRNAMGAFSPFYRREFRTAFNSYGLPSQWLFLNLSRGAYPDALDIDHYHAILPYTNRNQIKFNLEELSYQKWLVCEGNDSYRLTTKSKKAIEGVYKIAQIAIEKINPLSSEDMDFLNQSLHIIVQESLNAKQPQEKWSLQFSRWSDPGQNASEVIRTDQYLTDLMRFRDDSHIAAWKIYNMRGDAWEAVTYVWRGQAHTAAELANQLSFRGYSEQDYRAVLCDLAAQGWVEQTLDGFKITEMGERKRIEAEKRTDELFFSPWFVLNSAAIDQLVTTLEMLFKHLNSQAKDLE